MPGQTWPLPVRAGQAVIGVDPVFRDIESEERCPLRCEILFVGRAAGITDAGFGHDTSLGQNWPSFVLIVIVCNAKGPPMIL